MKTCTCGTAITAESFKEDYCSLRCWIWRQTDFCKMCNIEYPHRQYSPKYCSELCYMLYLYKVLTNEMIRSSQNPEPENYQKFVQHYYGIRKNEQMPFAW